MCDLVSWGRCDVVAGYVWISKLSPCCCGLGVGALLPQYSGRCRLLGQYCCSTALGSSCCGGTAAVQGGGGTALVAVSVYHSVLTGTAITIQTVWVALQVGRAMATIRW